MATCPTCGKEFKPCTTQLKTAFNWRAVACSWECATKYIEEITAQRARAKAEREAQANNKG